ncbi:MAG TPA: hypothetical protein VK782_04815 [Candidatus Sulfotelmatobacter sp.]|jgi:hypothetical protein|nr:hypothetical protein [Candidatus Sulfotelmatobacter sp.]
MTLRPGSLTFLIIATTAFGMAGVSYGQPATKQVNVYIDSVMAADTNEGTDPRLAPMGQKLRGLFGFSTYSLIGHNEGQTDCGKMIAFTLPGGKILHVQPRAIDGDMIAMEIVLFDGTRPMMTTDLKLKNNGTLIVGGPRYEQGMMIISIGASTGGSPPMQAQATPPGEATSR